MNLLERLFLGKKKIERSREIDRTLKESVNNTRQEIQVMESSARVIRTMTEAMAMMEPARGKDRK